MRIHDAKHLRTAQGVAQGTTRHGSSGFSILEIVIAMIIISILTLALIPTVTNRARSARVSVAERDAKTLAEAQQRLSVDTGFYARFYVLDDLTDRGDNTRNDADDDTVDGTNDEDTTGGLNATLTNISTIWISTITQDFQINSNSVTTRFMDDEDAFGWAGPYLNWNADSNGNDWPDDPWGNDYLFATDVGVLFTPELVPGETIADDEFLTSIVVTGSLWGGPGTLGGATPFDELFDRPAILSFGPDREPGDASAPLATRTLGGGDDIVISFGGN